MLTILYKRLNTILLVLLAIIIVGIYFFNLKSVIDGQFLIDDAYIYLRYVRNFLRGWGFVWNQGEQPVEGITSILYTWILILIERINLPALFVMPILGVFFTFFALALSWRLGNILSPERKAENHLMVLLLGLTPTFLFWSTAGLETSLYTALLLLSTLAYLDYLNQKIPGWVVGVFFSIATLGRPEGLAMFGTTILFEVFIRFVLQNHIQPEETIVEKKRTAIKNLLSMLVGFALIYAPIFAWRWLYFGYPFPNTYYAKTDGVNLIQIIGGLTYLIQGIRYILPSIGFPVLLMLLLNHRLIKNRKKFSISQIYIFILLVSSIGVVVLNGGDHFLFGRLLMPSMPFIMVLSITVFFADFLANLPNAQRIKPIFWLLTISFAFIGNQPWTFIQPEEIVSKLPVANSTRLEYFEAWGSGFAFMGKLLKEVLPPGSSIAVVPIGAIGYYSDMQVFDMLGLVDPVIAHENFGPRYVITWRPGHDKGNGKYILSREPDYIQLIDLLTSQPFPGLNEHAKQYKSIVEIWESLEFHEKYEFYPISTNEGWYYNLYRRIK